MGIPGKKSPRRVQRIEYVVSVRGSIPADLEKKVSDAHARALIARVPLAVSGQREENPADDVD